MDRLLIIIVVYNNNIENIINDRFPNGDVDILFYDNSKECQRVGGENIHYVHDNNNHGVSKAYNVGIKKAHELHKECVLLLDQDTGLDSSTLSEYLRLYEKYGSEYIYAPIIINDSHTKIYSPGMLNSYIGKVQQINKFNYNEVYDLRGKTLINSGIMIPLNIIGRIGLFNEAIKLDFSDFFFIEKYKKINKNIILLNEFMCHSLSGDEGKNFAKEMKRFEYYCAGAKELHSSLNVFTLLAVVRRMVRLIVKYMHLKPISIFLLYYIKE